MADLSLPPNPECVALSTPHRSSYLVRVGRYNDTYDGLRRVYLSPPRSYRLTATLEF